MSEKTRKILILSLLPIAIIWAFYNMPSKNKADLSSQQELTAVQRQVVAQSTRMSKDLVDEYTKLKYGTDPFYRGPVRSANTNFSQPTGWHLAGIIYNETNPHAVINSKIVKSGDSINGAEVVHIEKNRVVLTKGGSEFTLSILEDKS